jgi:hypothetical protein
MKCPDGIFPIQSVFHKTQPLPTRKFPFLEGTHPHPNLLVSSLITMAYDISLMPGKPENQFPFLGGSECNSRP